MIGKHSNAPGHLVHRDAQNKRFLEIADPHANARVVQADRLAQKPISVPRPPTAEGPLLPGTEPSPAESLSWEVAHEG